MNPFYYKLNIYIVLSNLYLELQSRGHKKLDVDLYLGLFQNECTEQLPYEPLLLHTKFGHVCNWWFVNCLIWSRYRDRWRSAKLGLCLVLMTLEQAMDPDFIVPCLLRNWVSLSIRSHTLLHCLTSYGEWVSTLIYSNSMNS